MRATFGKFLFIRATIDKYLSCLIILATNELFLTVCARRKHFAYDKSQQRMRFHVSTNELCRKQIALVRGGHKGVHRNNNATSEEIEELLQVFLRYSTNIMFK